MKTATYLGRRLGQANGRYGRRLRESSAWTGTRKGSATNKYGLDLDKAWSHVLNEGARDDIPDVLRFDDYRLAWNEWKAALEGDLDAGTYQPKPPRLLGVPKDSLLVRPFALLHLPDRAVYHALVEKMAPSIDASIPAEVYSHRLVEGRFETRPTQAWLRFQEAGRDLYVKEGYGFLITTDVVSYYEYVDIPTLLRDLKTVPGIDTSDANLLGVILRGVNKAAGVWGLPQGPEASSILGNFYLLPVDLALKNTGLPFIRYGDDLKIFGAQPAQLRLALRDITELMRARHLNVSAHKTRLLVGPAVLEEFEDPRKSAIQYGIEIESDDAPEQVRRFFDETVSVSPPSARDIKFAVYRLSQFGDSHGVDWVLDHLAEIPYLAARLVDYLDNMMLTRPEIEQRLVAYLEDPLQNIYPWSEIHVVRLLARTPSIEDPTRETIWRILRDENKDTLVRQQAARALGRHARTGDLALLDAAFDRERDQDVRRAIMVAIREASPTPPKEWLTTVAVTDPQLRWTSQYLRAGAVIEQP